MNVIIKFSTVMIIYALGFIIALTFVYQVNKKRLFNFLGLIIVAFGVGLGFGLVAYLSTFLDEKSQSWHLIERLSVGGEVFFWGFIGSIIGIPLAIFSQKIISQSVAKKNLDEK